MTSINSSLNPVLFQNLQDRFGEVRITNAGQQRQVRRIPDPQQPGRFRTEPTQRGEQMLICCPFCQDDRFRLYVSYQYGMIDPVTRRPNYSLWCCHNEKCHQLPGNLQLFRSMTAAPIGRSRCQSPVRTAAATPIPAQPQEIILPEGLIPIGSLPNTHPASAYLRQRNFDPTHLQELWGVSFCDFCLSCRPLATNRIVIPVYQPAQMFPAAQNQTQPLRLVGWQARAVPGLELLGGSDAKYLSAQGMHKSELLYGLNLALATTGPVYLVEGPTDCWRIGPGAVALFGKDLSQTQKLLLVHHFVGRPILVALDPDAQESAQKIQHDLCLARGLCSGDNRVLLLELPPDREDPAACTQPEIFAAASRALGLPISQCSPSVSAQACGVQS